MLNKLLQWLTTPRKPITPVTIHPNSIKFRWEELINRYPNATMNLPNLILKLNESSMGEVVIWNNPQLFSLLEELESDDEMMYFVKCSVVRDIQVFRRLLMCDKTIVHAEMIGGNPLQAFIIPSENSNRLGEDYVSCLYDDSGVDIQMVPFGTRINVEVSLTMGRVESLEGVLADRYQLPHALTLTSDEAMFLLLMMSVSVGDITRSPTLQAIKKHITSGKWEFIYLSTKHLVTGNDRLLDFNFPIAIQLSEDYLRNARE